MVNNVPKISISITDEQKQWLKDNKQYSQSGVMQQAIDNLRREVYEHVLYLKKRDSLLLYIDSKRKRTLARNVPDVITEIWRGVVPIASNFEFNTTQRMSLFLIDERGRHLTGTFELMILTPDGAEEKESLANDFLSVFGEGIENERETYIALYKKDITLKQGFILALNVESKQILDPEKSEIFLPTKSVYVQTG